MAYRSLKSLMRLGVSAMSNPATTCLRCARFLRSPIRADRGRLRQDSKLSPYTYATRRIRQEQSYPTLL